MIILEVRVRRLDSLTGVGYVLDTIRDLQKAGLHVILADAQPDQRAVLERTGILSEVGEDNIAWRTDIMNEALSQAWGIARRWHAAHPLGAD